ncbi:MAG: hypothetical protein OSA24_01015 [Longimicrobiales bacterium]|nr:hypothetical protein [Longimicrobiales bacterium]
MGSLLSNRNVVAAAVVLSLLAHLGVTDAFAYTGLVLVLVGMVGGFNAGPNDQTRLFLTAIVLNTMGNAFDAIPVLGPLVTGVNSGLATVTAAGAVMIVVMNIKNRLMGG